MDTIRPAPDFSKSLNEESGRRTSDAGKVWQETRGNSNLVFFSTASSPGEGLPGIPSPFPNLLYTLWTPYQIPQPSGPSQKTWSVPSGKGVSGPWSLSAFCKHEQWFGFNQMFIQALLCSVSEYIYWVPTVDSRLRMLRVLFCVSTGLRLGLGAGGWGWELPVPWTRAAVSTVFSLPTRESYRWSLPGT